MASTSAEGKEPVTRGTGNVFADLGFPDAAERQAKLRLAYALNQVLDASKLSQAEAAKVLGVTQPKVSALRHYKLAGFSVERLMNLLTALDQDVEIVIRRKPRSRKTGRMAVNRETAERCTILRGLVGSTVHGLNVNDGIEDRDEMGVCVEPMHDAMALWDPFEQFIYRSAAEREGRENARSTAGDLDLTVYSLRKWIRLALKG